MKFIMGCFSGLLMMACVTAQAQDISNYQAAVNRIEEARQSHADSLDLSLSLTELPPELFTLTEVTSLNLNYNHLTTLPPEIGQMTALTSIDICCGTLESLPAEIGQLTNLESLEVASNRLSTLPEEIANLKNLKALTLSGNWLREVPDSVWTLTSLEELWLDYNRITDLPAELGSLTHLTILNLGGNSVMSLPPEIERLTLLCWMDLNSNQLRDLPAGLSRLQTLTGEVGCPSRNGGILKYGLQIWGNPLPYPDDVINGDAKTIFDYLDHQVTYYLQLMLLIVGGPIGLLILLGLGIRGRLRRQGEKKKKRG